MGNIAVLVEYSGNQKLYICDPECREVISEQYCNEHRLPGILDILNINRLVVARNGIGRIIADTFAAMGLDVHLVDLAEAPADPRFANVAAELLFSVNGCDFDDPAITSIMRKSEKGIWRLKGGAKKRLDVRLAAMMAHYRKYS